MQEDNQTVADAKIRIVLPTKSTDSTNFRLKTVSLTQTLQSFPNPIKNLDDRFWTFLANERVVGDEWLDDNNVVSLDDK